MSKTTDYSISTKQLEAQLKSQELHLQNLQSQLSQIQSARAYQIWQNIALLKRGSLKIIQNPSKLPKALSLLLRQGPSALAEKAASVGNTDQFLQNINAQYQVWFKNHYPTHKELEDQQNESQLFKHQPLISIITPTYNTPIQYLRECIESVINQSYQKWELCLADDCSTNSAVRKVIKEYAQKDKRIKYTFRKTNGHISRASNSALKLATGEWVGLLDHDDVLWPNALYEVTKLINEKPKTDFIYSDEDKLSEDGLTHCDPFFKPGWSPDLLLSFNYITHFAVLKKSLVNKIGGFRAGYEGAQDYDLFLRATEHAKQISNVQTVLYSWRKIKNSTASDYTVKPQANTAAIQALEDTLNRRSIKAEVLPGICVGTFRVKYQIKGNPLVSIIIPTKDHLDLLERCLTSITSKSTYSNYEIIIVDTGSTNPAAREYYKKILLDHPNITLLNWQKSFNYSAVNNFAVSKAKGDYLLFLNNDTEVISSDWIECLLEHAQRLQVGAVGAKLLYPDGRIQHAGIEFLSNLWPHHYEIGTSDDGYSLFPYPNYKDLIKNPDSVTGACMMVNKKKFIKVGMFDQELKYEFQDVDLCIKLEKLGYSSVFTPYSELTHKESQSFASDSKSLPKVSGRFHTYIKNKQVNYKFNHHISEMLDDVKLIVNQINSLQ